MDTVPAGLAAFQTIFWIVQIWALVRALTRPGWAFEKAGKSKAFWVVVLVAGLLLPVVGLLVGLGYLFSTDRKVRNQLQLGGGIGFPGRI